MSTNRASFLTLACLSTFAASLGGCQVDPQDNLFNQRNPAEELNIERIVGGRAVRPSDPGHLNAVALKGGSALCTGALIAENLVVTAAHCVVEATMTTVHFGSNVHDDFEERKIVSFKSFHNDVDNFPNFDIAWVRFEGRAPRNYKPVKILDDVKSLRNGAQITLVGFGRTADRGGGSGNKLIVDTVLEKYHDTDKFKSLMVVGPTPGQGACHGDSGGPAYMKVGNEWVLAGVTNGVSRDLTPELSCESGHSIYTFVGKYKNWIANTSGVSQL